MSLPTFREAANRRLISTVANRFSMTAAVTTKHENGDVLGAQCWVSLSIKLGIIALAR